MRELAAWTVFALLFLESVTTAGAAPPAPPTPEVAQASASFNPQVATEAWLHTVPPEERALSDAYFEGGYWLQTSDFLIGIAVCLIFLETRLGVRVRNWTMARTRIRWLQTIIAGAAFILFYTLVTSPLAIYEGFVREHRYGLSNQNFSQWLSDQLILVALALIFGSAAVAVLFAVVRRFGRLWHVGATIASLCFAIFGTVIGPVFIAPLFNTYTPLPNTPLRNQIVSLARANGIAASNVYEFNASKQSKRVSANVSGVFGTDRISLNDNLLNRCSPECVLAVMGHEMGHYVMNHIYKFLTFLTVYLLLALWLFRTFIEALLSRFGSRWGLESINDTAVLPLATTVLFVIVFASTPLLNTYTRTQEYEADIFGLNAARQPDGEAEADMLLAEYRKLDPSPLEEFLFYDHPSGRTRIFAAMRWKGENLCLFNPSLPCTNRRP